MVFECVCACLRVEEGEFIIVREGGFTQTPVNYMFVCICVCVCVFEGEIYPRACLRPFKTKKKDLGLKKVNGSKKKKKKWSREKEVR